MDPLLDYYLCTKDGESTLVAAYRWEDGPLDEYDGVQWIPYWQALQLIVAVIELDRPSVRLPELLPLAAFMGASEQRIGEFFGGADGE